jgi:trimeric autotransporter adhesin
MCSSHSKIAYYALFAFTALLTACGGGGAGGTQNPPTPPAKTLTSIAITPATATVAKGLNTAFTATGTYSDASTANITSQVVWTSGNLAVATINGATGIATGVTVGNATITASLTGISSPAANVTVTTAVVTAITLSASVNASSVPKGKPVTFTATGTYSDGTAGNVSGAVTWISSNTTVATLNGSGIASTLAQGSSTITALANGVTSNGVLLTVIAPTLTAIAINPTVASVVKGLTTNFTATGTYTDATTANITNQVIWTSSNTAVAPINSTTGVATGVAVGTATVAASASGVSSVPANLTVSAAVITAISISPATSSASKGSSVIFSATGTYSDGTVGNVSGTVTWSSSNATVATVNASGISTALVVGVSTIYASINGISSNLVTFTVTPPVLTAIAVSPVAATVIQGLTTNFTAIGTYSDGSTASVTNQVTWLSNLATVATINTTGSATGVGVGNAGITAALNGITSPFVTLTVTASVLTSITIAPLAPSMPKGVSATFTATGRYSNGSTGNVSGATTWASSNTAVATISVGGVASSLSVGSTTITATVGGVAATTTLTITAPVLASISLLSTTSVPAGSATSSFQSAVSSVSIPVGYTTQFTAVGKLTDGTAVTTLGALVWAASNGGVTVSNTGLATGLFQGAASITVSSAGITSSPVVLVVPLLQQLSLTPASVTVSPQQLVATGVYSDGTSRDITATLSSWTSSSFCFATVSATGLVTKVSGLTFCPPPVATTLCGAFITVGFPVGSATTVVGQTACVQ